MKTVLFFLGGWLLSLTSLANVSLPAIFGNDMVLQRNKPIKVYGWAAPDEKITVKFNRQLKNTAANKDGHWSVQLAPEIAGGPYDLIIKGANTITFSNVLVGEVWICSGQSNMEWQLKNAKNAAQEIAGANFPQIRQIVVGQALSSTPKSDFTGEWKICSPQEASKFTAVGYFFARELYKKLKVPIGLINNAWGGTHVETWTSRKAFESSDDFKSMISEMPLLDMDSIHQAKAAGLKPQFKIWESGLPGKETLSTWFKPGFDDSKWDKMNLPGAWEGQGLENLDGTVLFRKSFNIDKADAGKPAIIELSTIDDDDTTYLNGVKIGGTTGYKIPRKYNVPRGLLKEGQNILAVRAVDNGGGGGFTGEASGPKLTIDKQEQSLAGSWTYKIESFSDNVGTVDNPNEYPTLLFNAMLHPLINFQIQGVIWYQGESNTGRAWQYRKAFPLMINDWRKHFKQGNFPFYYVQLTSFDAGGSTDKSKSDEWAELREAQALTLALPNTGMAVITDIGELGDIHPRNKQDVGKRLALLALKNTYGQKVVADGPVFKSLKVENNKAIVSFTQIGSGLISKAKGGLVNGFEIAGADKVYVSAKAMIKNNQVVVWSDNIAQPVAVRFGWKDDATANNLYNVEGLPAGPFSTDNWERTTVDQKFSFDKR